MQYSVDLTREDSHGRRPIWHELTGGMHVMLSYIMFLPAETVEVEPGRVALTLQLYTSLRHKRYVFETRDKFDRCSRPRTGKCQGLGKAQD